MLLTEALVAVATVGLGIAEAYVDDCSTPEGCCAYADLAFGHCNNVVVGEDLFELGAGCDATGAGYSVSNGIAVGGGPDGWEYTINICGSLDKENTLFEYCSITEGSDAIPQVLTWSAKADAG